MTWAGPTQNWLKIKVSVWLGWNVQSLLKGVLVFSKLEEMWRRHAIMWIFCLPKNKILTQPSLWRDQIAALLVLIEFSTLHDIFLGLHYFKRAKPPALGDSSGIGTQKEKCSDTSMAFEWRSLSGCWLSLRQIFRLLASQGFRGCFRGLLIESQTHI